MNTVGKSLLGMAITAGAVYFFDPVSGRRRRVLVRDRCARAVRSVDLGTRDVRHDLSHRMHELTRSAKNHLTHPTGDKAIGKQARDALKRAVSRPEAIGVAVHDGKVFLRGDVYSHEHQRALDELRSIAGVSVVTDHLTLREAAEGVRPLLDASSKGSDGWSMAGRLCTGAAGCALLVWGVRERKTLGELGTTVGHAIRRFSKMDVDGKLESVERVIDKGIDAAQDLAHEAAASADAHARKWQGEASPEPHARVAV